MAITSFESLKEYAKGTEVELPSFSEGQPLVALLRRASLLNLVRENKIPNKLHAVVTKMFKGDSKNDITLDGLKENTELMEIVARDVLVEPTFEQIENAGLKLTEEQLLAIFNFSQSGVTKLETFRTEQKNSIDIEHGEGIQQEAQ